MVHRLVQYGEVVGYLRVEGSYSFYSKDLYGWNGKVIEFDSKEKDSGYRDVNNQRIFQGDVIRIRYYRNPVALKQTDEVLAVLKLDKKDRLELNFIDSGEKRRVDFLDDAVSMIIAGRIAETNSEN